MKKALRLIALAAILATCWLSTEKPSLAVMHCDALEGTACATNSSKPCLPDSEDGPTICYCVNGHWHCV